MHNQLSHTQLHVHFWCCIMSENPPEPDNDETSSIETFLLRFGVIGELLALFLLGERWWMAPLVLLLGVLGIVLVVLQSFEYVAPFIYMAF